MMSRTATASGKFLAATFPAMHGKRYRHRALACRRVASAVQFRDALRLGNVADLNLARFGRVLRH